MCKYDLLLLLCKQGPNNQTMVMYGLVKIGYRMVMVTDIQVDIGKAHVQVITGEQVIGSTTTVGTDGFLQVG